MKFVVKKLHILVAIVSVVIISAFGFFIYSYLSQKVTRVRVANLTPNSVTITWISNKKDLGYVLLSESNNFNNNYQDLLGRKIYGDVRGNGFFYTHYVTLTDLSPEQTYYFRISNGLKVWDLYSTDQSTNWYEIETSPNFSFTTKATPSSIPAFPNDAYGLVSNDNTYSLTDSIVFAVANKADESGGLIDNTDSEVLATLVDENGGWMLDKTQFTSSRLDQNYTYKDNEDFIYIYPQIENILMPGSFGIMGKDDSPFETISLESSNKESNILSLQRLLPNPVSKVSAANLSNNLCCALTISGKANKHYDFEEAGDCSSCGSCFPIGRKLNSGTILGVEEFRNVEGKNVGEQRKNCESKKSSAGSIYNPTEPTSSGKFPNGVCNTNLKDDRFEVSTINRGEFIELADQFGEGNYAKACYNYVVCNAKKDGINPEMELAIWLHESAASNYKLFPTVEDMGIHCYGGNSKFKPYPCNTTPKKNLAMQVGMFNALPHTTCLSGGSFDPVKWAAGFWTGSACDMAKGTQFVSDLQLYWSRIRASSDTPFPTWIKDPKTAQPNLNCEASDNGNDDNGGNDDDGGNDDNGGNDDDGKTPVDNTGRICCAMILEGENQFRLDSERTKNCTDIFKIGGTYGFKGQTKKINYVVRTNINDFNSCEGKVFPVACQTGGIAVPKGLKAVGQPAGDNTSTTKCVYVDPKKPLSDDGIIDIPAVANKPVSILSFVQPAYAEEENFIKTVDQGLVSFTKDGLYTVKIKNYTINDLPVNADQKYRFYVDKNKVLGYQTADDLINFNLTDLKITRKEDVTRVNIGVGSNLINLTIQPKVGDKVLKASSFLDYANVEGIKIIYITFFEKGQWQKGLRARTDGVPGYIGTDFNLVDSRGYLIISNTDLSDKSALVLPGVKTADPTNLKLLKGWNLISTEGFKSKNATELVNLVQGQTKGSVSIAQWVNNRSIYDNLQNDKSIVYGNDFKLNPSLSYFIFVDKNIDIVNP